MKYVLTINLDNDAFICGSATSEVARILRTLASGLTTGAKSLDATPLIDVLGNTVGCAQLRSSWFLACARESIELRMSLLDAQVESGDWRDACECWLDDLEESDRHELSEERERLSVELVELINLC